MDAFDITLYPPQVCLVLTESQREIVPQSPDGLVFGTVRYLNQNNLIFDVGDRVLFNKTEAILITQGETSYFITDEKKVYFKEAVIP